MREMIASDGDLWVRILDGERDAFGDVFSRHAAPIYNFCFRRTADWAAAEDLTSAVFLVAWQRKADARLVDDSVLPWLYGIAINVVRNHRRSLRRQELGAARMPNMQTVVDPADGVAERLDDAEQMGRVLRMLERLPQRHQDVITLCLWQGLSYEEAALALKVPVGTLRSRLSRARRRLRKLAASDGHVGPESVPGGEDEHE